ncbi:hypothetical protein QOZ80_8AG0638140 [Eleusine coracana subsp. coracana]|nr:hypothetical protein QOZ80_8AG0638140 [Eleusine coracana subsp. coracana]
MEQKKKHMLRRLTIISIPFVFVAIPSVEYFHYFILDPYKPRQAFFQPQVHPYIIYCEWGYMGNFLQNVVVFNSSAGCAAQCRVDNDGCRYLFQDGHRFRVTGKHDATTTVGTVAGVPSPAQAATTRQRGRRRWSETWCSGSAAMRWGNSRLGAGTGNMTTR